MNARTAQGGPSFAELVIIISLMMSLTALSIDAGLPALPQIGSDLEVQNANDRQLVVSVLFLGLAFGQTFFGPLSDSIGRKPTVYAGYALYIAGALLSALAISFPMMLVGRLAQGLGISAPQAITLALVRDRHKGRPMARVMSYAMTVTILAPMIAPTLAQTILLFSDGDLPLRRRSFWQLEFPGHGAIGPSGRDRSGSRRFPLDPDIDAPGYNYRSALQRYGTPLGRRFGPSLRVVPSCGRFGRIQLAYGHAARGQSGGIWPTEVGAQPATPLPSPDV